MNIKTKLTILALAASTLTATAQTDITKYYLSNPTFDSAFDYPASSTANVTQEIKSIDGWTPDLSANYTITGVYEWGFGGTFNGATVPAKGYDGEAGGGLALSTGWDQTFVYYQTITLPAGTYTVTVPTYNGKTVTAGTSLLAWVPTDGSAVKSSVTSFAGKAWTVDQISFTLTQTTTGRLQVGLKAASGGSANSANIIIDYVKLTGKDMAVDKSMLAATIQSAQTYYGTGSGTGAADLKTAIDSAQSLMDDASADMPTVLQGIDALKQAIATYRSVNISEDNPVDYTDRIANPSFEQNGTEGWTAQNMAAQGNSVFSVKQGYTYVESWVGVGNGVGNASVSQTLAQLPDGNYTLSAVALNIQQSGDQSTTNAGSPQTGAYLFAGKTRVPVTAMQTYTLKFAVVDGEGTLDIGLLAENCTGNYLCVDNFRLLYTGAVSPMSYARVVQGMVDEAQALLDKGIQQSAATTLRTAMDVATTALQGTGTDDTGNTIYDLDALKQAKAQLATALATANDSRAVYDKLQTTIDYAQQVYGWWKDDTRKATIVQNLKNEIDKALVTVQNFTLTASQIYTQISTLNARAKFVDKLIYCSTNACGTDTELKNSDSYWSYDRSMQSKHWILFWEKGYGTTAPSAVKGILDNADRIFELYADSLKFITINQGKSKTDTYKMIIRLRYTDAWEANGSGIDNTIGMLTLSRWAYTSRSGQTAAHEIGHCFQYQVHCDNNDWNGWMYTWADSPNGNVFWEMCAQWQAYKYYPAMQFDNEWLTGTLNGLHKHPLCEELRYNNYFIEDYFCHKQGMGFIGRMWNESYNPEDPLQTYMRLTMNPGLSAAQKLDQLNNDMWEYGARMTTFDLDSIRSRGASAIGKRAQTTLSRDAEGYWEPTAANCIENFGNNAIRLNVPSQAKAVYADLVGEAGKSGYIAYNTDKAGWKFGFVALKRDGTRVYGDIATATAATPEGSVKFDCPADCSYLWLVVSGAPTSYWSRGWNGTTADDEQWPYKVKLYQTNVYGYANVNDYPTGIVSISSDASSDASSTRLTDENIYNLNGQVVGQGHPSAGNLAKGIYVYKGKKYIVK
ncbi:MAG: hypothetical protein I3J02_06355 [Prevotella sp.]|nr:hypothetical protein [Prevotella sp.]